MIERRPALGLALLCVLGSMAIAAQSAGAIEIPETTAFECTPSAVTKDFSDAHCDTTKSSSTFGHKQLSEFVETAFSVTNAKTASSTTASTPASLEGEVDLVKTSITCTNVSGSGALINEKEIGTMKVEARVTVEFTGCTVIKPAKCTVAEPIKVLANAVTRTNLGASKEEMGLELQPATGGVFATIEYTNLAECILKNTKVKLEGTAIGTGSLGSTTAQKESGATLVFGSDSNLIFGGKPATFKATVTPSVTANGNAITLTTPPYHA